MQGSDRRAWNFYLELRLFFLALLIFPQLLLAHDRNCRELLTGYMHNLQERSLLVDKDGLLVVSSDLAYLQQKVVSDWMEMKALIAESRQLGQHILLLPGSYDVIHQNHALFVQRALEAYMQEMGLRREQVLVVLIADGDRLIGQSKASKFVGFGGSEPLRRPLQSEERFPQSPMHPRLADLASIPIADKVYLSRSPLKLDPKVILNQESLVALSLFVESLPERAQILLAERAELLTPAEQTRIQNYVATTELMIRQILNSPELGWRQIQEIFSQSYHGHNSGWDISAWNLFLYSMLELREPNPRLDQSPFFAGAAAPVVRMLNVNDGDYFNLVQFWNDLVGVRVRTVVGPEGVSTSKLLKEHPPEVLLERKQLYHNLSFGGP